MIPTRASSSSAVAKGWNMVSSRARSVLWFVVGVTMTVGLAGVFVGVRTIAAPGSGETTFVPIAPCRLFDYRPAPDNVGPRVGALGPSETSPQQATGAVGDCNVPSTASGVSMNVTIVAPTAASYLTIFPANLTTPPTASNLNWVAGQSPTPNKVDVKLSPTGAFKLFNRNGNVFVLGDVVGYHTNAGLADLQSQLDGLRNQTITFSGYDMQTVGSLNPVLGTANGCPTMWDTATGFLSLPIPLGTTITSVTSDVYPASDFTVDLQRRTSGPSGDLPTTIGTATGVAGIATVTVDITPPAETVGAGERFTIRFDDGEGGMAGAGSGLCSVTVGYRLAGG
jgi:hypothetical protein